MELRKSYYPEPRKLVIDVAAEQDTRAVVVEAVREFQLGMGHRPTRVTAEMSQDELVTILNSSGLAAIVNDLPPWKTINELLRHYLSVHEIAVS